MAIKRFFCFLIAYLRTLLIRKATLDYNNMGLDACFDFVAEPGGTGGTAGARGHWPQVLARYRPRFFDLFGHQIGNKHFFIKSCHCQTYQDYEQSRQKLGTFL